MATFFSHVIDLEKQLLTDSLTNAHNRHYLERLFNDYRKEDRGFQSICYLDFDHFIQVNHSYGHEVGDQIMIQAASRLKILLRGYGKVVRLEQDEFILLFDKISDLEFIKLLDVIIDSMAEPHLVGNEPLTLTFSIGVVRNAGSYDTFQEVLTQADSVMAVAKKRGKNNYVIDEVMDEVDEALH
ncbi:GGDEF domain-containing protein [Halalkalibacillus sediminis]|nr:GGDEF domain-containing protein [Halalkalibacillus sediminis]